MGVCADVLFARGERLFSHIGADLSLQFVQWRSFGFGELSRGNLALWNPYVFSGAPFFGGFQSALLYPLNWFYLIQPLVFAINFGIVLHVFLAGAMMYVWGAGHRLHPAACVLAGSIYMLGTPYFFHIYAGHLPNLTVMPWAPLIFYAIDRLYARPAVLPVLLGIAAVSMQILAGHPQYIFYCAVAAGIYAAVRLVNTTGRVKKALGFAAFYGGAVLITAVQLLSGFATQMESVRSGKVPYEFVVRFFFPPENLLTLIYPGFFGDVTHLTYWGRWYLWEVSLFIGVCGALAAGLGAVQGRRPWRWLWASMAAVTLLFALGSMTPLFRFLYEYVPGFSKFRGISKFIFLTAMFLAMLAALGVDRLIRNPRSSFPLAIVALSLGLVSGILSLSIWQSALSGGAFWRWIFSGMKSAAELQETFVAAASYGNPANSREAGRFAAQTTGISAAVCIALSAALFTMRRFPKAVYGFLLVGLAELVFVARGTIVTFNLPEMENPALRNLRETKPGDYRIFQPVIEGNSAMHVRLYDIWGFDPVLTKRYAEFMAFTQDNDPNTATQDVRMTRAYHPWYKMLRCQYVCVRDEQDKLTIVPQNEGATLPRLQLVQDYTVLHSRDEIFAEMNKPEFDPLRRVILESEPSPAPAKGAAEGTARVVGAESSDHFDVEVTAPRSSILLISDNYSTGWSVRALPGSSQREYKLLPANYVLRAIPLSAGTHRLRVEYLPAAFRVGAWISGLSLAGLCGFAGFAAIRSRRSVPRGAISQS